MAGIIVEQLRFIRIGHKLTNSYYKLSLITFSLFKVKLRCYSILLCRLETFQVIITPLSYNMNKL